MKGKSEYDYEDRVYLKADPTQDEFIVVGFIFRPGQTKLEISYLGDVYEVYEFEVTKQKDPTKTLDLDLSDEE